MTLMCSTFQRTKEATKMPAIDAGKLQGGLKWKGKIDLPYSRTLRQNQMDNTDDS